jgi:hypothetical protein
MHLIPPMSATCRGYLIIYILNSTDIWCRALNIKFFKHFLNNILPLTLYFEIFSSVVFNACVYIIT